MNRYWNIAGGLTALALAACSSVPLPNAGLDAAKRDYAQATSDPNTSRYASAELSKAKESLDRADFAWRERKDPSEVDSAASVASQRAQTAINLGAARAADAKVEQAGLERERLRAEVRTRQAQVAQGQAATAEAAAIAASERANRLQRELAEIQAKPTPQGLVVMLQDVLFDTGKATLKEGAYGRLDTLSSALRNHPERRILIEGFTDSTGGAQLNLDLSRARAESVRDALVKRGVDAGRIDVRGNGEARPVASNDNAAGRQQNRRVEIVFSDERGAFPGAR
ncbi:OmpA family protein [Roseateles chitinivorans]|uniref:OmpA family protein n=1 Tax=Roseateles chitinivorans TaxID=2917965 RepID=UPI003D66CA96